MEVNFSVELQYVVINADYYHHTEQFQVEHAEVVEVEHDLEVIDVEEHGGFLGCPICVHHALALGQHFYGFQVK